MYYIIDIYIYTPLTVSFVTAKKIVICMTHSVYFLEGKKVLLSNFY